ncbi:oxygen-independent coproporphyrinogen III oxidase [Rudanella paleaurantiibacter]|uniref:Coproporphyrinogen-III oxidase n=1 Tax=Rudanella paleaurantiibacter TaxID=2614655 RepID=A0A7J5U5P1_9BACT|nr:oxygen-independent coproporphyrinogen III oxidase [Rudanella paleaurantiibacter]KAB7733003.1 oxygen-independent coproporphyrinogen III oxidase [Rudanella paleaurantiibacter]
MTPVSLIQKYNVAGPRYTSYPAVPHWNTDAFTRDAFGQRLLTAFAQTNASAGISLYIHLPYCESLCTFCGCHKRITKNHGVEQPYINAVLAEWNLYCDSLAQTGQRPRIAELHLGGGTPSFFASSELNRLMEGLFRRADSTESPDYGWEGHPNNTTAEHLQTLYNWGFRRVSFGVQDYDPVVQRAIHRHQPFAHVEQVTRWAREIGYTSISHDLVFGLPFQQLSSIENTIRQTLSLQPDRLSFYSYAHVPWVKGTGQRGFRDEDLPSADQKRKLYETGRDLLEAAGYSEIGIDHFAKPHDGLFRAMDNGTLHRNFMGYTTQQTRVLLGLGASAISDVGMAFGQNEKNVDAYLGLIAAGELPVVKGHVLSRQDGRVREHILNLMCRFQTSWAADEWTLEEWEAMRPRLEQMAEDGLIEFTETSVRIAEEGRPFIRNVCMVLDRYLPTTPTSVRVFSSTV